MIVKAIYVLLSWYRRIVVNHDAFIFRKALRGTMRAEVPMGSLEEEEEKKKKKNGVQCFKDKKLILPVLVKKCLAFSLIEN